MNNRTNTVIACVACLVVGYFIGREHIKYEMRSAFQGMQTGLASVLGGGTQPPAEEVKTPAEEQPIIANLVKKGFSPKDIHNGKFEEEITIVVSFDNKAGKAIRAFDGVLEFTDLLGNRIIGSRIEINEQIAQGSSLSWDGALEYNQFTVSYTHLTLPTNREV